MIKGYELQGQIDTGECVLAGRQGSDETIANRRIITDKRPDILPQKVESQKSSHNCTTEANGAARS
jgi:hypothetical protein